MANYYDLAQYLLQAQPNGLRPNQLAQQLGQATQPPPGAAIAFEPQTIVGMLPEDQQVPVSAVNYAEPDAYLTPVITQEPAAIAVPPQGQQIGRIYGAPIQPAFPTEILPLEPSAIATRNVPAIEQVSPRIDFSAVVPEPDYRKLAQAAIPPQPEFVEQPKRKLGAGLAASPMFAASSVLAPYLSMFMEDLAAQGATAEQPVPATIPAPVPEPSIPTQPVVATAIPGAEQAAAIEPQQIETVVPTPSLALPATAPVQEVTQVPTQPPVEPSTELPAPAVQGQIGTGGKSTFKLPLGAPGAQVDYDFEYIPASGEKKAQVRYKKPDAEKWVTITEGTYRTPAAEQTFKSAQTAHQALQTTEQIYKAPDMATRQPGQIGQIRLGQNWKDLYIDPKTGSTVVLDELGGEEEINLSALPGFEKDVALQNVYKQTNGIKRLGSIDQAFRGNEQGVFTFQPVEVYADREKATLATPQQLPSLQNIVDSQVLAPHPAYYEANIITKIDQSDKGIPIFGFAYNENPPAGTLPVPMHARKRLDDLAEAANSIISEALDRNIRAQNPEIESAYDKQLQQYNKSLAVANEQRRNLQDELTLLEKASGKRSPEYKQKKAELDGVVATIKDITKKQSYALQNPTVQTIPGAAGINTVVTMAEPGTVTIGNMTESWSTLSAQLLAPPMGAGAQYQVPEAVRGTISTPQAFSDNFIKLAALGDIEVERSKTTGGKPGTPYIGELLPGRVLSQDRIRKSLNLLENLSGKIKTEALGKFPGDPAKVLDMPINGDPNTTLNKVYDNIGKLSQTFNDFSVDSIGRETQVSMLNKAYDDAVQPLRSPVLTIGSGEDKLQIDNNQLSQSLPDKLATYIQDPAVREAPWVLNTAIYSKFDMMRAPETQAVAPSRSDRKEPIPLPYQVGVGKPGGAKWSATQGTLWSALSGASGNNPLETIKAVIAYQYSPSASWEDLRNETGALQGSGGPIVNKANLNMVKNVADLNKFVATDPDARKAYAKMFATLYDQDGIGYLSQGTSTNPDELTSRFADWADNLATGKTTIAEFLKEWTSSRSGAKSSLWLRSKQALEMKGALVNKFKVQAAAADNALADVAKQMDRIIQNFANAYASLYSPSGTQLSGDAYNSTKALSKDQKRLAFITVPEEAANAAGGEFAGSRPQTLLQMPAIKDQYFNADPSSGLSATDLVGGIPATADLTMNYAINRMYNGDKHRPFAELVTAPDGKLKDIAGRFGEILSQSIQTPRKVLNRLWVAEPDADNLVKYVPGDTNYQAARAFLRLLIPMQLSGFNSGINQRAIKY